MKISYEVEFLNVGRDKRSWTIYADAVSEDFLALEVRKRRVLLSRDIEVVLDDPNHGIIYVGRFRAVGRVKIGFR